MNCDEVFEILTAGPFPRGDSSDGAVEGHLAQCNDCRALAAALRPAVERLASLADEPVAWLDLPGYWGEVDPLPQPQPELIAIQQPPARADKVLAAGLLIALAASILLAVVQTMGAANDHAPQSPTNAALHTEVAAGEIKGDLLAAVDLSPECYKSHDSQPAGAAGLACCTDCHRANSARYAVASNDRRQLIASVAASCRYCH